MTSVTKIVHLVSAQVFLSYGPHDNAHLLVFYGFVVPDNPNDTVLLQFKVRRPVAANPRAFSAHCAWRQCPII